MTISKEEFSFLVKTFRFRELFNNFGWNNDHAEIRIEIGNETFVLKSMGDKSGFKALTCSPNSSGKIPEYPIRKQIHTKTSRVFKEHIIIFTDKEQNEQLWQYIFKRQNGLTKVCAVPYHISQDPEKLYQRTSGMLFTLDEEENITIIDVTQRVQANLAANSERVTKRFYEGFRKEHKALINFISGIDDPSNIEWYASLMLSRLMFCYFIQKQGFLDNDRDYLHNKLHECREKNGKDRFYSFYRNFLLALFHEGLGSPSHSTELKSELGNIPYLNGGLFDVHEIESIYEHINISDEAFIRIFDFFDQWDWHLDTRPDATGREINPDVLGYIFEKYINDRAQMGAYYTQEDITEYIARNCIIPYLFDETKNKYPDVFKSDGFIWSMLRQSGDKYIFDAVKKGIELPLPDEIEVGIDTSSPALLERRKEWNKITSEEYALPTEIWRETIERRKRYFEIFAKIKDGLICDIQDFITYNLNIRAFLQDILDETDDAGLIDNFYSALTHITILDPTCGSGAFLFAALEILEPLYETCLMRMDQYVRESSIGKNRKSNFEKELKRIEGGNHPNKQYYIYKSIILNNLHGVDIMNEAVETAKLRLFLKLVSTTDPDYTKENMGLEPLPDIDFNIKAGNSLVGFANIQQLKNVLNKKLDIIYETKQKDIEDKCFDMAMATERYKNLQLGWGDETGSYNQSKIELTKRQKELNDILNHRLFEEYETKDFESWKKTHQPFHWITEYYDIIENRGGFNVIMGNPPYVEYIKVKNQYRINNYKTIECGNLYAYIIERNLTLLNNNFYSGMIIPHSSICTDRMESLMQIMKKNNNLWISTYDIRPCKLFNGADQRLAIYIQHFDNKERIFTTKYNRWNEEYREHLFKYLSFSEITGFKYPNSFG